jgi:hypothetical protein
MDNLIAYCGLDCKTCDVKVATENNNNVLRATLAARMQIHYKNPEISIADINCSGCRKTGVKMWYCELCEIKKCATSKSFQTCAMCEKMETCQMVGKIHKYDPTALNNLKMFK